MKRLSPCFLWMALLLLLAGCSAKETPNNYTVEKYGSLYTVDMENSTISDGTYTYQYELQGMSNGYALQITYPDGSTYWWNGSPSGGYGGWSDDYDENRYVSGFTLMQILEEGQPVEQPRKNIPLALLLLAIGIFHAGWPRIAWHLQYGWRFKDAEPSDLALGVNRFGGAIAMLVGILVLFI